MMRQSLIAFAVLVALPALAQEAGITLPSGRIVTPHDVIAQDDALRYRFLEPDLGAVIDVVPYASLEADMRHLCETYALDLIEGVGPAQIVISISDRPVEFGANDPDASQVFEAYRVEDRACIWEEF